MTDRTTNPAAAWSAPTAPTKKSRRWLWIVLVVVVLFIAGIASCAALVGSAANHVDKAVNHANAKEGAAVITLAEFNKLTTGMTRAQAVAIVGGPGKVVSTSTTPAIPDINEPAHTTVLVSWDGEGLGDNANATFQDDHLVAKAQFGLK